MLISEKQVIYIKTIRILVTLINFSASRWTFGLSVASVAQAQEVITKCKAFNYSNLLTNWENYEDEYVNLRCSNLQKEQILC